MDYDDNSNIKIPDLSLFEDTVLTQILKHLSYHDLATLRIVCLRFKELIRPLLNEGFNSVRQIHRKCLKEMKEKLPRRESQRLLHPLGGHYFLLTCLDPKIELLFLTYLRYKNDSSRIFIPGKVLDELFRSLGIVQDAIKVYNEGGTLSDSEQKLNNLRTEISELMTTAIYSFEECILSQSSQGLMYFSLSSQDSSSDTGGTSHSRTLKKKRKCVNAIKLASLQIELNMACRRLEDREQALVGLNKTLNEQATNLKEIENLIETASSFISKNYSRLQIASGVSPSLHSRRLVQSPDVESQKRERFSNQSSVPLSSNVTKNLENEVVSDSLTEMASENLKVSASLRDKRKLELDYSPFCSTESHL